jgi:NhaA family Na+:H+ antiporter
MSRKIQVSINRYTKPIQKFIENEQSGSILLIISVVIAMYFANSGFSEYYFSILDKHFGFVFEGSTYLNLSLQHWINDGLMSIFFFVVGLELKRELLIGELADFKKAALPIGAAIGGMLMPAIIYVFFNNTGAGAGGWAIPMATDIAFALGVLYMLGNRIPLNLKIFLTALAIVDDLGAIIVIALFYTNEISIAYLALGGLFLLLMFLGNIFGVRHILYYLVLGVFGIWLCFLNSGVHATIAAVLAAFTIPMKPVLFQKNKVSMLDQLEKAMHPVVTFLIVPLFALANAGVSFKDLNLSELLSTNVLFGVLFGLLAGKILGVFLFTKITAKLLKLPLENQMNNHSLFGLSALAAIGFTMSLFVTNLAFDQSILITQAKVGIFIASIIGGIMGFVILKMAHTSNKKAQQ